MSLFKQGYEKEGEKFAKILIGQKEAIQKKVLEEARQESSQQKKSLEDVKNEENSAKFEIQHDYLN